MEEKIAESSSSISLFSSFCEKSIGNEDDRGYVTRSWPYWRRATALNPLKSAGRRVKQLYTCTVRAIDDHRGRHLVQFEFRLKLFYTEITAAWKFDEFSKILNYAAYFNNFKFNWGIRDPRKDRQCLALYHSPRPLFLSLSLSLFLCLSRSAQKQRQQRSGDRLGHWIPKVLSHVTRKLPIHVPVRRFILRKHPTSQQTRTPLGISIISRATLCELLASRYGDL